MESGYDVIWTDHALAELGATFRYLENNFPERVLRKLAHEIERITYLISKNPFLFAASQEKPGVRKAVIEKFNSMYYRVHSPRSEVEILSFFSNRQDPGKRNL